MSLFLPSRSGDSTSELDELKMKTVLIVEDNDLNMKLFHDLLDAHGYNTIQTKDGMEALGLAREHMPDLILMDVVMPDMNGFQATRQLTKGADTAHIPIVIVTTKDQETDRVWGQRQGARDYLTKPVGDDVLRKTIDRRLAGG